MPRVVVQTTSRPCLPRHVRLRDDPVRGRLAVLAPEKVMWPDAISAEILGYCNGRLTIAEIAARLARDYAAPRSEIEADVIGFLQDWSDQLLIRCAEASA